MKWILCQPKHLGADLVEAFENPDPDPVHVEEARERIGRVFERGMKVPLQHEDKHSLPADFRLTSMIRTCSLHRAHYQRQWKPMPCNSGDFPFVAVKVSCILSTWTEGFPSDLAAVHCIQKELPCSFSMKKMEEKQRLL